MLGIQLCYHEVSLLLAFITILQFYVTKRSLKVVHVGLLEIFEMSSNTIFTIERITTLSWRNIFFSKFSYARQFVSFSTYSH